MATHQILGLALVVAGCADALACFFTDRFVADPTRARIVRVALAASAVGLVGLGAAFLTGALG